MDGGISRGVHHTDPVQSPGLFGERFEALLQVLSAAANNKNRVDANAHDAPLGASAQATSLAFGQATPNSKTLVIGQRVLEALSFNFALSADFLGVSGGPTFFGEKSFWICLRTQRICLPGESPVFIVRASYTGDTQSYRVDEPVIGNCIPILAHTTPLYRRLPASDFRLGQLHRCNYPHVKSDKPETLR